MPIATATLSALTFGLTSQTGSFTTDAAADVTTTTTAAVAVNATVIPVVSSAPFTDAADIIDFTGAGPSGGVLTLPITGVNLQGANQLVVPNPAIQTAVAIGAPVARYNRLTIAAQPRHVRITKGSDYYDWVAGMEPFSADTSIGGVVARLPKVMLCQSGAVHFAPGMLTASSTYTVLIEY